MEEREYNKDGCDLGARGNVKNVETIWLELFKKERVMENKIKAELEEYGLTIDQLTPEELDQLKKELEDRENGIETLDGVLSDPMIKLRGHID